MKDTPCHEWRALPGGMELMAHSWGADTCPSPLPSLCADLLSKYSLCPSPPFIRARAGGARRAHLPAQMGNWAQVDLHPVEQQRPGPTGSGRQAPQSLQATHTKVTSPVPAQPHPHSHGSHPQTWSSRAALFRMRSSHCSWLCGVGGCALFSPSPFCGPSAPERLPSTCRKWV